MDFVIENCGNRADLMAQMTDTGRYPDSRRLRFMMELRQDYVPKESADRQKAHVLINGHLFFGSIMPDVAIVWGHFTREFDRVMVPSNGIDWWAEKPFQARINFRRRTGKLKVLQGDSLYQMYATVLTS